MPEPLRVLHVYAGNLYGGVERMLAQFAAVGTHAGMEPSFALCFEGRLADELRAAGAPLDMLGPVRLSRPWTAWRARRRLEQVLRARRPHVVVCHSTWTHGVFAPTVRRAGLPLVFWLHDSVTGATWADRLARRTPPDLAICTSRFAGESLGRLWSGVPGEVVYPPVPPAGATTVDRVGLRAQLDTPADDAVILQATRMEPWKGHRVLIQALETIHPIGGWTCWIAGGAQRPHEEAHLAEMYALAQQLGIAHRIRFLGQRDDVPALMASADVQVAPNLGPEPFGIALAEGMSAGLPVVSAEIGAAREIVDPACGILVPPDDPAALGEALRRLVLDPALRARMGAAGPPHAQALCGHVQQVERLREVLDGVVDREGGVGRLKPRLGRP
jgi:glycosyltransferase involved in cell wall biosynthesis